jgi:ABC-type Na+ transport system ATPase subunit NatA
LSVPTGPASLLRGSAEAIGNPDRVRELVSLLDIGSILNREIRRLSTGGYRVIKQKIKIAST